MADVTISELDNIIPSSTNFVPISNGTNTGKATLSSLPVDYSSLTNKPNLGGMQTFSSGSGTWTVPTGVTTIKVILVGGGGGGCNNGNNGSSGGSTTFTYASVTYTAGGGGGGTNARANAPGPAGGTAIGGDINIDGGRGAAALSTTYPGGCGANSLFGFGGVGANNTAPGIAGTAGTGYGAGGGGGVSNSPTFPTGHAGGGSGATVIKWLNVTPNTTASYSVGAAGAPASTSNNLGGAGAGGVVIIEW